LVLTCVSTLFLPEVIFRTDSRLIMDTIPATAPSLFLAESEDTWPLTTV
jgi:hypothetical protein